MARVNEVRGDMYVHGNLGLTSITIPSGTVENSHVSASAAIAATKMEQQYKLDYQQTTGADVAAGTQLMTVVRTAGTIVGMDVRPVQVPTTGDKTYSVDLHRSASGGAFSSVLSAVVTIGQTDVDLTVREATISASTLVDGDALKVVVTSTGSTGNQGKGVVVTITTREGA